MFFNILKKLISNMLEADYNKRLGENILQKKIENLEKKYQGFITYDPYYTYLINDEEYYIPIYQNSEKIITDIKFDELENFIIRYRKRAMAIEAIDISNNEIQNVEDKIKPFIIFTRFTYIGTNYETELVQVRKEIANNPNMLKLINHQINSIFVYQKDSNMNQQEARSEISKIKDRCIFAIRNEQDGEIEKLKELYITLTKKIIEFIKEYKERLFSKKQEVNELSNIATNEITPIKWLFEDINYIYKIGLKCNNGEIIKNIICIPRLLMELAIEYTDHTLYQECMHFPEIIYLAAFRKSEEVVEIKNFMYDRAWRYLKEISDFDLLHNYKKNELSKEDFKGFTRSMLKMFQLLLKASYENRDIKNFNIFIEKAYDLFSSLKNEYDIDDEECTGNKNEVSLYIDNIRSQMIFGLSAWVLAEILKEKDIQREVFLIFSLSSFLNISFKNTSL
jgi:hypothetical protein